jgi:hypothetical protein
MNAGEAERARMLLPEQDGAPKRRRRRRSGRRSEVERESSAGDEVSVDGVS